MKKQHTEQRTWRTLEITTKVLNMLSDQRLTMSLVCVVIQWGSGPSPSSLGGHYSTLRGYKL